MIDPKSTNFDPNKKKRKKQRVEKSVKDEEFYVEYRPKDYQSEKGFVLLT